MRHFTTTGPVASADHYCIPPLSRLDLDDVLELVRDKKYFVLHAPRQTGKTSTLLALRELLNSGDAGEYRCVYVNVEAGQAAREDKDAAIRTILGELADEASLTLGDEFLDGIRHGILSDFGPESALRAALSRWARADPRPLVLLIDEIDALVGDALLSVLRQLRAGYARRPDGFPQSIALCGVRDMDDYRVHSLDGAPVLTGGSPFNIVAKSLRLGDFSRAETSALLMQHTAETGQAFDQAALDAVWTQTRGQPWLVNALAAETCFENKAGRDRSRPVTADAVSAAREQLILRRATHLKHLANRLTEDRVRRVIEPLLSGGAEYGYSTPDLEYVRDLGLIARDGNHTRPSAARRQSDLRGSGAAGTHLRLPGEPDAGHGRVRGSRRRPGRGQTAGGFPSVLPRALGTLGGTVRVPGGRPAATATGISATDFLNGGAASSAVRFWDAVAKAPWTKC